MKEFQNSAMFILCFIISTLLTQQRHQELKLTNSDEPIQIHLLLDKEIKIKCYEIFETDTSFDSEFYLPIFFSTKINKFGNYLIVDLTSININFKNKYKICIMTNEYKFIWSEVFVFDKIK